MLVAGISRKNTTTTAGAMTPPLVQVLNCILKFVFLYFCHSCLDNYHLWWKNMSLSWRQSPNLCFIYFRHSHLTIVIFAGRMCLPHEGKSSSLHLCLSFSVSPWIKFRVLCLSIPLTWKYQIQFSCKVFQCWILSWILNNIFANAFKVKYKKPY